MIAEAGKSEIFKEGQLSGNFSRIDTAILSLKSPYTESFA